MIDITNFQHKRVAYFTLGCKLNFAETSTIGKILQEQGFLTARKEEQADLCIVNTCSVTELADKKSRQTIRKIIKQNPNAFIVVTGCYAQLKPGEIEHIEGVDLIVGSEQKQELINYLGDLSKHDKSQIIHTDIKDLKTFAPSCSQGDRTRFFLKVQDGCDYYCSYCTIPFARGRSRNGTIAELVAQATDVAAQGGKEIVLTGVNIGDFGKSTGDSFLQLIEALDEVEGIERYRISSIEPNLLTDEAIQFVARSKRFAPHFHIPLQSGSDEILRLMKRRYDTALFRNKIERIKSIIPHAFIGVDVIVGVRGETPELFKEMHQFIESLDISQLHVFSYSERPGTKALEIDYKVDPKSRQDRCHKLLEISERKLKSFYQSQCNKPHKILFEHNKEGKMLYGFTENYVRIGIPYRSDWENRIVEVRVTDEMLGNEVDNHD